MTENTRTTYSIVGVKATVHLPGDIIHQSWLDDMDHDRVYFPGAQPDERWAPRHAAVPIEDDDLPNTVRITRELVEFDYCVVEDSDREMTMALIWEDFGDVATFSQHYPEMLRLLRTSAASEPEEPRQTLRGAILFKVVETDIEELTQYDYTWEPVRLVDIQILGTL